MERDKKTYFYSDKIYKDQLPKKIRILFFICWVLLLLDGQCYFIFLFFFLLDQKEAKNHGKILFPPL